VGSKALILSEQLASSFFNFIIVILLSKVGPESVAKYGLIYSFALVYVALMKNGAYNVYLTSGGGAYATLVKYVYGTLKSKYTLLFTLLLVLYSFFDTDIIPFLSIFSFYVLIEFSRVYYISIDRTKLLFCVCIIPYVLILAFLYYSLLSVAVAFLAASVFVLVIIHITKDNYDSNTIDIDRNLSDQGFILTVSYSVYSHGPLWVLYLIDDNLVKIFVQVRNIFQPVQVLSRASDFIEKKLSSKSLYSYKEFLRIMRFQIAFSLLASFICASAGYFLFSAIYVTTEPVYFIATLASYLLISVFTFISKPMETFFYKKGDLGLIIWTRLQGAMIFLLLTLFLIFLPEQLFLLGMLLLLVVVWGAVCVINLLKIRMVKYEI